MYRFLVRPDQSHYLVEGCGDSVGAEKMLAQAECSEVSLQLKWVKTKECSLQHTLSATENSKTTSSGAHRSSISIDAAVSSGREGLPHDDLDLAIVEAKAVKELVRLCCVSVNTNIDVLVATRSRGI